MMIGDPYRFAVLFDRVSAWNPSATDCNGYFALCIDGKLFPEMIINAIIPVDVVEVKETLSGIPVNETIYDMDKENSFKALYELVFPEFDDDKSDEENKDNDYRYLLSIEEMTDDDYLVFAVEGRGKIRILAGQLEYDWAESRHIYDEQAIHELILDKHEVDKVIEELEKAIRLKAWF